MNVDRYPIETTGAGMTGKTQNFSLIQRSSNRTTLAFAWNPHYDTSPRDFDKFFDRFHEVMPYFDKIFFIVNQS